MLVVEQWENMIAARQRMRLLCIFKRYVFKIIILCKARQKWSEIGAWLNVNRRLRDTNSSIYLRMSAMWNPFGAWIRFRGGFLLFSHLRRVRGVLRHTAARS